MFWGALWTPNPSTYSDHKVQLQLSKSSLCPGEELGLMDPHSAPLLGPYLRTSAWGFGAFRPPLQCCLASGPPPSGDLVEKSIFWEVQLCSESFWFRKSDSLWLTGSWEGHGEDSETREDMHAAQDDNMPK